jgi:hypothetical protein
MTPRRRTAWGALFALTVTACSSPLPQPTPPTAPKAVVVAEHVAAPAPGATLQVVKWPELEKAIASHKGKVVVLDVWAEY